MNAGMDAARCRDQRGGAAVELAVLLPALVLVALLATATVRLVLDYSQVNHLAQVGARYATRVAPDPARPGEYRLRPTADEVEAYVRSIADVPVASVEVSPDPATAFPGTDVTVTVRSRRELGVVGAGFLFPDGGVELSSTVVMREE